MIYKSFTGLEHLFFVPGIIFYGIGTLHIKAQTARSYGRSESKIPPFPASPLLVLSTGSSTWRILEMGERVMAGILLVLVQPLIIGSAFVVAMLSRRSPFVAHCRVGQQGKTIWVLKLRTMWEGKQPAPLGLVEYLQPAPFHPLVAKAKDDPRVKSKFAAACRRYSIDELPQLWNVLTGDLSLVGPRPLTRAEIDVHYGENATELLSRRPGITGLWQVYGRSRLTYHQRRRLDLFMIRKWSLGLYFRIWLKTIPNVLLGKDAY